jgi:hypothetical protein
MTVTGPINDTEVWIVGTPGDIDTIQDALSQLGYVAYAAPPQPGRGHDKRHRAYMRILCRVNPAAATAA